MALTPWVGADCLKLTWPLLLGVLARVMAMKALPGLEIAKAVGVEDWFTSDRAESSAWLEAKRKV